MRFSFDEDQLLFQTSLRDFLLNECTPEVIRAGWEQGRSHSPELWANLAELGVTGLLVPEAYDGLGMSEIASVLLFEEAGRAALPEPVKPSRRSLDCPSPGVRSPAPRVIDPASSPATGRRLSTLRKRTSVSC